MYVEQSRGQKISVRVSDAWFIGSPNYLRAWAAFHAYALAQTSEQKVRMNLSWLSAPVKIKNTRQLYGGKRQQPARRDERLDGGETYGRSGDAGGPAGAVLCDIPRVDIQDLEFLEPIGYGRRGTTFKVCWNGGNLAAKMFDTSKNNGAYAFERETQAYEYLREAWGTLIPRPRFIVENCCGGMVLVLGMDLAYVPVHDQCDQQYWEETNEVLLDEFGFHHLDLHFDQERDDYLRNCMLLPGSESDSVVYPVVIDLESYKFVGKNKTMIIQTD